MTGPVLFRDSFGSAHASPRRSSLSQNLPFARDDWRENRRNSPRFRVRSLLDLFKARIGILNPIACLVNFSWIDWDCARNRLGARYQLSVKLHRFRAFDWKFPVMPEFVERVEHRLCFNG